MNIADSMRHVLKNKSQNILTLLVKEDLKNIFKDFVGVIYSSTKKFPKKFKLKESLEDAKDTISASALLMKEIPRRLNDGFRVFSSELLIELDKLPDQKQKTIFCMKVLAGLSKLAISSVYDIGLGDAKLLGFGKKRSLIKNVVLAKLVYKTIQALIIRMIQEMEKELTDLEELEQLQTFKKIVMDDSGNAIDKFFEGVTDADDRAFTIVNDLKRYIQSGHY